MAESNGYNPTFPGKVTAETFRDKIGTSRTIVVATNGTTAVNIFGATNGIGGTITDIKIISKDDANGTITVATNSGTVATIVKGSQGAIKGSAVTTTFTAAGTATVVSNAASGNANVEVSFIPQTVEYQ